MCMPKPKKPKSVAEQTPDPQYMRNPWLDGLAIGGVSGAKAGRNSLRIDMAGGKTAPSSYATSVTKQQIPNMGMPAANRLGIYNGGWGGGGGMFNLSGLRLINKF